MLSKYLVSCTTKQVRCILQLANQLAAFELRDVASLETASQERLAQLCFQDDDESTLTTFDASLPLSRTKVLHASHNGPCHTRHSGTHITVERNTAPTQPSAHIWERITQRTAPNNGSHTDSCEPASRT